jgi:serine/threonine protein phosphatase 1
VSGRRHLVSRLIAIGDIHGRLSQIEELLDQINPKKQDTLVFLGDYIDRGPHSFEVVELIIRIKKDFPNTVTLRGNHEDFVLAMFRGNQSRQDRDLWLKYNGGDLTLASYRIAGCFMNVHRDFYEALPIKWETDRYFFCHAGVKRGTPLDKQKSLDLLSTRGPYPLPEEDLGKVVVHGHSILAKPLILENRINIDTGAGSWGFLTAIELPSLRIWQT